MKILFTGASSFTGYWFVKKLCDEGHDVTCSFTERSVDEYTGIKKTRVERLLPLISPVFNIQFGSAGFLEVLKGAEFDILCHHAAEVKNYKDPEFNVVSALEKNTWNITEVFKTLQTGSCKHIMLTGSVFEALEGAGTDGLPNFSPYGLSKYLTSEMFHFYAKQYEVCIGKFVIPNPFGPFEEKRLTHYLVNSWLNEQIPELNTPLYVRDNIHIQLLAEYYSYFIQKLMGISQGALKLSPSGYTGSQGDFVSLFSAQMSSRLSKSCIVKASLQTEFSEPLERINTDRIKVVERGFNEKEAWDCLAAYYLSVAQ